jgi:DNA-binding HxlR family transcriptional regulator
LRLTSVPVQIHYALTDPGKELVPIMFAMAKSSMKNFPKDVFEDGKGRTPEQVAREIRATGKGGLESSFP